MNHCLGAGPLDILSTVLILGYFITHVRELVYIVSWGNFGLLRALFLFWPSNRFGMGFGCPRSYKRAHANYPIDN